jgi:metal-responsive CopG/Arc/MetJ family transcriptional regulator
MPSSKVEETQHTGVNLPVNLRERVEEAARKGHRNLSEQIIHLLEKGLEAEP